MEPMYYNNKPLVLVAMYPAGLIAGVLAIGFGAGRMICYQEYDVKSPLNGLATKWVSKT